MIDQLNNIDCSDDKSRTALQLAANRNMQKLVELLIIKGAEINSRDQWEVTPLMRASYNRCHKIMSLLIENDASVNSKSIYGKSAILYAAENGSLTTIELLLEHGADINDTDSVHTTCLHHISVKEISTPFPADNQQGKRKEQRRRTRRQAYQ